MSTYYTYYTGYSLDGKIYPLGPYNCFGSIRPVLSKSSSFASRLHDEFGQIKEDQVSDELRKAFEYKTFNGEMKMPTLYSLPIDELPVDSYIKTGYFLIDDVKQYEEDGDTWDIFYEKVAPTVYAAMVQHELMFGKPKEEKDCEGNPYTPHAASDYMYYAYPDYNSEEYEAEIIRAEAYRLKGYNELPEGAKLVAILHIG